MLLSLGFVSTTAAINHVCEQGLYFYTVPSEKCLLEFDATASREKKDNLSPADRCSFDSCGKPFVGSTSDKALIRSPHNLCTFFTILHSGAAQPSFCYFF